MAGFVDKFKKLWDVPDDEYEEYNEYNEGEYEQREQRPSRTQRAHDYEDYEESYERDSSHRKNVVNINATAKLQVALFKPERFGEETRAIADELMQTHTVILNLEDTNKDMARRIIDFLSGVAYANHGKIKKVAVNTFIIIPNNVDLTGDDLLDELEHSGVYF